jgi:hypothetical protein
LREEEVKSTDQRSFAIETAMNNADEEKVIPWAEGNGLWDTISKLISDLAGVDLVTFFVQNPYAYDSAEGLAVRIGRRLDQIKPVLDGLVEAGLLRSVDLEDSRIYALPDDADRRQTLQQYVSWLQEGYHWARMAIERDS